MSDEEYDSMEIQKEESKKIQEDQDIQYIRLSDTDGKKMTFPTRRGLISVGEITDFFGSQVGGISFVKAIPQVSDDGRKEEILEDVFLNISGKTHLKLDKETKSYQVYYKPTEIKPKGVGSVKSFSQSSAKMKREQTARSIVRKHSSALSDSDDEKHEEKPSVVVAVSIRGLQFRLSNESRFRPLVNCTPSSTVICLDKSCDYEYNTLVDMIVEKVTNVITRTIFKHSRKGIGSYNQYHPFFADEEKNPIGFWPFFENRNNGFQMEKKKMPALWLYATADDWLRKCINGEEESKKRPSIPKLDDSRKHPKLEVEDKVDTKQAIRNVIISKSVAVRNSTKSLRNPFGKVKREPLTKEVMVSTMKEAIESERNSLAKAGNRSATPAAVLPKEEKIECIDSEPIEPFYSHEAVQDDIHNDSEGSPTPLASESKFIPLQEKGSFQASKPMPIDVSKCKLIPLRKEGSSFVASNAIPIDVSKCKIIPLRKKGSLFQASNPEPIDISSGSDEDENGVIEL